MLRNYFKIAWRTLVKNKIFSFIAILGLTLGIWSCMSVATVIIDDLTYDLHWEKKNDIYRITTLRKGGLDMQSQSSFTFAGLAPVLMDEFPEVEAVSNINTTKIHFKLSHSQTDNIKVNVLTADTIVWKILDFRVINGNPENYVHGKGNLVISQSFKETYFPGENPVGREIFDVPSYSEKPNTYVITGVIEDIPSNSHLRADVVVITKGRKEVLNKNQFGTFGQYYVLMKPNTDIERFTNKLNSWYADYVELENPDAFKFQPIKDIYLHSDFAEYQVVKGSYTNIFILSGVALLLLIIACANFVNLSTARALKRLREIGVRKVLGAARKQLIFQFLTESFLYFFISTCLALFIYQLTFPFLETYLGHALSQTIVDEIYLFGGGILIILFISLIIGGYPAFLLSGLNSASALKGNFDSGDLKGESYVRKGLVALQFVISVFVLISLIVVSQQVSFMNTRDLGYTKENLIGISPVSWDGKGLAFKEELLSDISIESASISTWIPTKGAGYMSRNIPDPTNPGKELHVWYINADTDLAKTLDLKLVKGRFLNPDFSADQLSQDSLMRMEVDVYKATAIKQSSLITKHTAGVLEVRELNKGLGNVVTTPVGIVRNFNNESLKNPLQPTIIMAEESPAYAGMLVRIKAGYEKQAMDLLQATWSKFYPNKLLDVSWVDEMLEEQYREESKLHQLFALFSFLSMFLAALGIFGLVVQSTEQRIKEIGIRKVLGASINSIVLMFSRDFLKIVAIAVIIGSPLAWYAMKSWLNDFAYRIEIQWWVFLVAGLTLLFIALVTVGLQTAKAAMTNPAKSLKTE